MATRATTSIATPTPMPAFAPVDRPELLEDGELTDDAAGELAAEVVLTGCELLVEDNDDVDVDVDVGVTAVTEKATLLISPTRETVQPTLVLSTAVLRPTSTNAKASR